MINSKTLFLLSSLSFFCAGNPINAIAAPNDAIVKASPSIEFFSLEGANEGNYNVLRWTITLQKKGNCFILERSTDGVLFEPIATIDGSSNEAQDINYLQVDPYPLAGDNHYRLRKTDGNGLISYSNVVLVYYGIQQPFIENVKTSSADKSISFDFNSPHASDVLIVVLDGTGNIVMKETRQVEEGINHLSSAMNELKIGTYILQVMHLQQGYSTTSRVTVY
jgi:hypothetical protein